MKFVSVSSKVKGYVFIFLPAHSLIYFGLTAVSIWSALCVNQGNLLTHLSASVPTASGLESGHSPRGSGPSGQVPNSHEQ